ncbi:MAG: hypothetical protein WEC00_02575 [Dongiaceae bacterium]
MSGNSKRIWTDLKKLDAHVIQPGEYDDAPEWTAEDLERADLYEGEKLIRRGKKSPARR